MGCVSSTLQTADSPVERRPQEEEEVVVAQVVNPVAPSGPRLVVGERVVAKYPPYRGKPDDPWFCGIVEALNGDFCDVRYTDGDNCKMLRPEDVCRAPKAYMNVGKHMHRFNDICSVLASYDSPFDVFSCSSGWVVADDAIAPMPSKAGPRIARGTFRIDVEFNGSQELYVTPHVVTWKGLNASFASGDACWVHEEDSQLPVLYCSFYVPWASSAYCSITGLNETLKLTFEPSMGEGTYPTGSVKIKGVFQRSSEGGLGASGLSTSDVEVVVKSEQLPKTASVTDGSGSSEFICPVCKEAGNKIVTAPCNHTFCIKCVVSACGIHDSNHNRGSCPQCAAVIRAQELTVEADDGSAVFIMEK